MIKAQELRIGNLFWDEDSTLCYFAGAWERKDGWIYRDSGGNTYKESQMYPIPLTTLILKKCGFHKQSEKTATGFTKYCTNMGMMLLVDHSENPLSNIEAYYERHLMIYECVGQRSNLKLHQLQNLNFALTNSELEINLNQ